MIYLIIWAVQGAIWGFATNKIVENKGYDENWFWWGFFFGLIALLVALSKPTVYHHSEYESSEYSPLSSAANSFVAEHRKNSMNDGDWECYFCHRINADYVTNCGCGKSKEDSEQQKAINAKAQRELRERQKKQQDSISDNANTIELIKEYKELLDSGAITQEEFDKKKSELL